MARKYVRFNYFEVVLVPARFVLEEDLNEEAQSRGLDFADPWDMSHLLNYLSSGQHQFSTAFSLGDEYADIEPDSFIFNDQYNIMSFQLSKLRDTNIPAKKKLGEIKEQILLEKDEYIGEFVSILYDASYYVAMVQSNLYGLSIKQIEHYLSDIRFRYLNEIGESDEEPLMVKFRPLLDNDKINQALESEYYRKIKIRASDVMFDTVLNENSLLSDMSRYLAKSKGVNIELQISLGNAERTRSLDPELIRQAISEFRELPERYRPRFELTVLENEEAEVELINLVEPRMTDRLSIEVPIRRSIGHEYLFQEMLNKYLERRPRIRRILNIVQ